MTLIFSGIFVVLIISLISLVGALAMYIVLAGVIYWLLALILPHFVALVGTMIAMIMIVINRY